MAAASDQAEIIAVGAGPAGRRTARWWMPPAASTVVIVALVVAYLIASSLHAGVAVSPAVSEQLDAQGSADVVVSLPFGPEQFHSDFFQACCAVAQVNDDKYYLQDATPGQIDHIASQYWVSEVNLWKME